LSSREDSGFADLESFKELPVFADRDMTEQWASLVETTDYFLFTAEAEVAERRVRLYSVLHRDNSQVTALARSYIQPW
jgi:general secretion pathway protein K